MKRIFVALCILLLCASFVAAAPAAKGKLVDLSKAAVKSLVWYDPKALKAAGLDEPKNGWTWDDMLAASNKIIAASGWVGTDWLENIFLRQNGPQKYMDWYNGKLAWTSPR
jgi:alpha-glucoside transport system substrate-binding protein